MMSDIVPKTSSSIPDWVGQRKVEEVENESSISDVVSNNSFASMSLAAATLSALERPLFLDYWTDTETLSNLTGTYQEFWENKNNYFPSQKSNALKTWYLGGQLPYVTSLQYKHHYLPIYLFNPPPAESGMSFELHFSQASSNSEDLMIVNWDVAETNSYSCTVRQVGQLTRSPLKLLSSSDLVLNAFKPGINSNHPYPYGITGLNYVNCYQKTFTVRCFIHYLPSSSDGLVKLYLLSISVYYDCELFASGGNPPTGGKKYLTVLFTRPELTKII